MSSIQEPFKNPQRVSMDTHSTSSSTSHSRSTPINKKPTAVPSTLAVSAAVNMTSAAAEGTAAAAAAPPPVQRESDTLDSIRDTTEYRAAWDVELWKAIQADRFRVQLASQRQRALAELARSIKTRQRAAQTATTSKAAALAAREEQLHAAEKQQQQQQQRLTEMERDLRRARLQLLDAQRRVEEEVRTNVRRAAEEVNHKVRLMQERVTAAEAQTRRAEERQKQAQEEYMALYAELGRVRAERVAGPIDGNVSAGTVGGAAQGTVLTELLMSRQQQQQQQQHAEELRMQRTQLECRYETQLQQMQRRCSELEGQNRRLAAAVARSQEQLKQNGGALQATRGHCTHQHCCGCCGCSHCEGHKRDGEAGSADGVSKVTATAVPASVGTLRTRNSVVLETAAEVERLKGERVMLVTASGGALRDEDVVVRRLDSRIRQLESQLALAAA